MSKIEIKKEIVIKTVLLGEAGVGKSCIILRYINDIFSYNHISTILSTFSTKKVILNNNKLITFNIWDTAGEEKFRAIAKINYKDAAVIILVFDITNKYTFQSIKDYWYPQIKEEAPRDAIMALAAAKCDLFEEQEIEFDEVETYAKSIDALFHKTSSLNNIGISELFEEIGKKILSFENFPDLIYERTMSNSSLQMDEESNDVVTENNNNEKKIVDNFNPRMKKDQCC